jgi:hypothetical protein
LLDEKLRPFKVAIAGQQRVIKIEEREVQLRLCYGAISSRTSGTVIARLVSSE